MGSIKDIFNLVLEESIMLGATPLNGIQKICVQIFEFDENRELNIFDSERLTLYLVVSLTVCVGVKKNSKSQGGISGKACPAAGRKPDQWCKETLPLFIGSLSLPAAVFCLLP